ncbi:helix-turn-helix domain-containing protein [Streptomyces sp. NPDC058662]|uniref:helix-turn-helix domain-containing protein n=1 Tax=Streptomyces sp. NPDC058662 TaxID=3346583 RepID=UPI003650BDCC
MEHNPSIREEAVLLLRRGVTNRVVAEHLGIPRGTVGWWRHEDRKRRGERYTRPTDCPRCTGRAVASEAYAYLLGLYLGDGHIVSKYKEHRLSVFCDASWPGLIEAARDAMLGVMPQPKVGLRRQGGCVEVKSYSHHWPCLFPQHGAGKKHERRIVLDHWQREIVDAHPWEFVRGLIHSDGCRTINWTTRVVAGVRKRYEYPRYFFTNRSEDITHLLTGTLDRLGVAWKQANACNISIARKESVALMDLHIGPKY